MGGPGSTRWLTGFSKETTDDHFSIDIRWMNKKGLLEPGKQGSLTQSRNGRKEGAINFRVESNKLVLNYRYQQNRGKWESIEQTISFYQTPCNFGGHRKWFRCPHCSRRVAVIYGARKYFLCRHCYNLTYASQQDETPYRLLRKSLKIREKLGDNIGFFEITPPKPKGMHWETYYRLCHELEATERRANLTARRQYGVPI